MSGSLFVVGLSHHTAPVEIRERVAFREEELASLCQRAAAAWARLNGQVVGDPASDGGEAMVISTCNRVELYVAAPGSVSDVPSARAGIARFLAEEKSVAERDLVEHLYGHTGEQALRHLFRVASSLDSAVVGEPQILGQVKDAYEQATRAGTISTTLGQAVPRAFSAAKRVRTDTQVARSSASVASAAVEVGQRIFGDLRGKDVLVVGAGKMGALATRHLLSAGCARVLLVNRTFQRAEDLANRMNAALGPGRPPVAAAEPWERLPRLLAQVDIVLSSTGAAQPIITRELVHRAMKERKGRWLYLLDMAVPRDVAPDVATLANVYLYDVDSLTHVVDDNLAGRRREAKEAERIVEEEVARFAASQQVRGVVPTLKALREHFQRVARAEALRTIGKLQPGKSQSDSERDRREVNALADSIVNKLLHAPLMALKRNPDSEVLVAAVRALFPLGDGDGGHLNEPEGSGHSESEPARALSVEPVLRVVGREESGS